MHKLPFLESSEARGRRNSRAGVIRSAVDVVDVIVVVVVVDVVDVNSRAGVTHSVDVGCKRKKLKRKSCVQYLASFSPFCGQKKTKYMMDLEDSVNGVCNRNSFSHFMSEP